MDMILHNGALIISDGYILYIYSNGCWKTTIPPVFTGISCKLETSQNSKPSTNESPSNLFRIPVVSSGAEGKASITTTGSLVSTSTTSNSGLFGATKPRIFGANVGQFGGVQRSPSTSACSTPTAKPKIRLDSTSFGKLASESGQATSSPSVSQGFPFGGEGNTLQSKSATASNTPIAKSETRSGSAHSGKFASGFGKATTSQMNFKDSPLALLHQVR